VKEYDGIATQPVCC